MERHPFTSFFFLCVCMYFNICLLCRYRCSNFTVSYACLYITMFSNRFNGELSLLESFSNQQTEFLSNLS